MQALEHPVEVDKDFLPLNGTDHVEFYVGNARQAAYYYRGIPEEPSENRSGP